MHENLTIEQLERIKHFWYMKIQKYTRKKLVKATLIFVILGLLVIGLILFDQLMQSPAALYAPTAP